MAALRSLHTERQVDGQCILAGLFAQSWLWPLGSE